MCVLCQSSIRHDSNTVAPRILVRLEKVHKTGIKGVFEKVPEETLKEEILREE
jgi:hypothetical protein